MRLFLWPLANSGKIWYNNTENTYGQLAGRTGTSAVIFGYNGRDGVIADPNGLLYMRARYYSPAMKRFVNTDIVPGEISDAVTLNRFAYANGNPVNFVDPFGLSAKSWLEERLRQGMDAWNTHVADVAVAHIEKKTKDSNPSRAV